MLAPYLSLFVHTGLSLAASMSISPVLTYSTYLRDSFTLNAIDTDSSGNVYMAGNAIVDPVMLQTIALVVKLNPQASRYLYFRYLGSSAGDYANGIAVDKVGNAYVAGVDARLPLNVDNIRSAGCTEGLCVPLTLYPFDGAGPGFGAYIWAEQ